MNTVRRKVVQGGSPGRWAAVSYTHLDVYKRQAFVTLVGRSLEVTVLVDSGTEGTGRIQAAISAGRLASDRLVTVGEITGKRNGDVEDLFAENDYLALYNVAFNCSVTSADLPPGDRIVKRLEAFTGSTFDHFQPAATLLRDCLLYTSRCV